MKRFCLAAIVFMLLGLLVIGAAGGCTQGESSKLSVVTSTSLMEYIARQVGGDHVDVVNLIPPNQHPGNFDAKPGDIQKLAGAGLFLLHGWPGEGFADKIIASADNPELTVVKATVEGNWMIPSVQAAAADKVAAALSEVDGRNAAAYEKNAAAYKNRIQAEETAIRARLAQANVSTVKVIASARQADFLKWAGYDVVGTFAPAQSLTPQVIQDLVDKGRAAGATLVVNNLQDGKDAGKAVADDLGARNVNLSNFPGGFDNTGTWEAAIGYNVDVLLNAPGK